MASFKLVDPTTGAALPASASLTNCYMVVAKQIFPYTVPRVGTQHTPFMREPRVLDCQSYKIGVHLTTNTKRGQVEEITVLGDPHGGGYSKIT